ncbi:MAG: cytochrome P450 [Nannocystaceae bacterium]
MQIRDRALGLRARFDDPAVQADPYPLFARMRDAAPLVRGRMLPVGDAWFATRYDDVAAILKDPERFHSDPRPSPGARGPLDGRLTPRIMRAFSRSMIFRDGVDHRRVRGLVSKAFTPAKVDELTRRIEAITGELLAAAAREGSFDLMRAFALPLPLRIISELLGVDKEEEEYFHHAAKCILYLNSPIGFLKALPRLFGLQRFFATLLARKRARPGDDLTSALIAVEEEGDRLTGDELLGMVFLLLFAGHETTVNLLGNGALALCDHPEQFERLRADPSLVPAAVEEMLRFESPAQQVGLRYVAEAGEVGGMPVRRGEWVIPLLGAANRDAGAFDEPDVFDVGRQPNRHVAFGLGRHFCLGAPLSRVEGRIAFSAFVERFAAVRLAIPRDAVRWNRSPSLRGLTSLPVTVTT